MNNKDIVKEYFKYSFWVLGSIFLFLILISDEYIASNDNLVEFSNIFSSIFPNIENHALKSSHFGLYNKMKLALTLGIFISVITFVTFFPLILKMYLCSLNIMDCSKKYILENIRNKNIINLSDFVYLLISFLLMFFVVKGYYIGTLNIGFDKSYSTYLFYGSNISICIQSLLGYFFILLLSILICQLVVILYDKLGTKNLR